MDPVNLLFTLFSLGIVTLWAARLAMGRRRSPYLWGGAALGLSILPIIVGLNGLQILGILPVVALMIMQPVKIQKQINTGNRFCPYCGAQQTPTYNIIDGNNTSIEWTCSGCDRSVTEHLAPPTTPEPDKTSTDESDILKAPLLLEEQHTREEAPTSVTEPEETTPTYIVPPEKEAPNFVPSSLTAQVFTDRGKALLSENKFTEAIDQFTKALAMDKVYIEALNRRIAAYQHLGLTELAAKDEAVLGTLS